jgi:hypothetical protein
MKKKNQTIQNKNFQEFTFALFLHQWFKNIKYTFSDKCKHHGLQITVHFSYMLGIYYKGQMLNSRI